MTTAETENVANSIEKLTLDPKKNDAIDVFNSLKEEDFIRGTTPEGLEKRCLELCQAYIGGSWLQTSNPFDVTVTRITGGLTNQLYKCSLNDSVKRVVNTIHPDEPSAVAIKLYQPKHMKNYHDDDAERLSDTISLTILGETGLGPKIYGIFEEGVVQEFIDNELFTLKYQKQPDKLQSLIEKLARFHHLSVPIRKNHDWILEEMKKYHSIAFNELGAQAFIEEFKLETLCSFDIRQEYPKLVATLQTLNSPKVFCHNDFRGSNLLVRKSDGNIFFVDAEYCAYGDRAQDISTYLNEWGFEQFDINNHGLPADEAIVNFVKLYIAECDKLVPGYSKKGENSLATIVKEVKIYTIVRYMFVTLMIMSRTTGIIEAIPFDPKSNMQFAEFLYKRYWETKQRLLADGTLKG